MGKRMIVGVAVVMLSVAVVVNSAFAQFDALYTVGSSGSTTAKSVFGWTETPYLYLNLPGSGAANPWDLTLALWTQGGPSYSTTFNLGAGDTFWQTPSNWSSIKALGVWTATATTTAGGGYTTGSTGFTVAPEPISTALFLIGGGTLAVGGYLKRRRRQAAV